MKRRNAASMRSQALRLLIGLVAVSVAMLAFAASASAVYDLQTRWGPQNLEPGGFGEFVVTSLNKAYEPTDGSPITVTLELPPGVTRVAPLPADPSDQEGQGWICSGSSTVVCTSNVIVSTNDLSTERTAGALPYIFIRASVAPEASGIHTVTTRIEGGTPYTPPTEIVDQVQIGGGPAGFGFVLGSFEAGALDEPCIECGAPSPIVQAGTHPQQLQVNFEMNLRHEDRPAPGPGRSPESLTTPEGHIRTLETTLPRGLIGNPEAVPKCEAKDFLVSGISTYTGCPPETQVGIMDLQLSNGTEQHGFSFFGVNPGIWIRVAVYNLVPPKGEAADFGFHAALVDGHIYPKLDPTNGYAIKAEVPYTSDLAPVRHARFTMWGVPGAEEHTKLRYDRNNADNFGAPFSGQVRPLLTTSSDCSRADNFKQRADSWSNPGAFTPTVESAPVQMTGCDDPRIRFEPKVDLQPSSVAAGGPTGLQVNLKIPQREQVVSNAGDAYKFLYWSSDIRAIDTPPMKKTVITFPEGMTISTSAAQGLGSCSRAQIGIGTNDPVTCPASSEYGFLTLNTPLLPKDAPMRGRIYIAKQNENPFHNFLSLYLVIQDPERGLLVKLPGKADLDPVTGQITTTFDDLPQLPVSDLELTLKGGNRAALVNPSTCGKKMITVEFFSWADPTTPITSSNNYVIDKKDDGSPCVNRLGDRPFKPSLEAGMLSNAAGSYSPFAFRLQRSDNDQEFSQLGVTLPKGLLAKIAGIPKCSDAAIAAAEAPGRTGIEEADNPSCPASSRIGSTDVGTGVGQVLAYIPGKAYLAGPYKGAPLSTIVITPILSGPYDLGVIAVRSKIDVDPTSAQATVITDPLPQIFKGIPVRIRDVRVKVDRDKMTINPTNCEPMQVTSHVTGSGGDVNSTADDTAADLSNRFQAADCANLPFKPSLAFKLKGGTNRGDYPAFTATLRGRPGDANIARAAVTLPHSEFLAQEHIRTVCTRVQFAQKACPPASVYGYAKATSPLFDGSLEGPVYLRSSNNPLPDLVAALDGEIDVVLSGRIDTVNAGIRNTFDVVPDAPVSTFTLSMQGGKKGLLQNSKNLCKSVNRADVRMSGQNGKRFNSRPVVVASSCKKARKGKKAKRRPRADRLG